MTRWLRGHSRAEELSIAFQSERETCLNTKSYSSEYSSRTPYQGYLPNLQVLFKKILTESLTFNSSATSPPAAGMNYCRRISSALIFFCLHILQSVWSVTTVAPACKSGENCTTALMHTTESPDVAVMRIVECAADISKYCVNGQCLYLLDVDEHYCRCEHGYMGLRCTDSDIVKRPMTEEYLALTIFLTALLLLAVALIVFFAYKWYALKKSSQSNQKYKEVSTQNI